MIVIVVAPLALVLLFQAKQIHPGADVGGVNDVEAVGDEAPAPGLLHHLIEQFLKALHPKTGPEAGERREIGR